MGRILRIYRDGRKHQRVLQKPIPGGAKGNMETLKIMRQIVLEDSQEQDLKNFVNREIIGTGKNSIFEKVEAIFTFARDKIVYEPEKEGFETVADLWSCLYALNPDKPIGDCVQKSVFIATCLSYLNLKPEFVAIQQIPNAEYFNHVYVQCLIVNKLRVLDATPKEFQIDNEAKFYSRLVYPIF